MDINKIEELKNKALELNSAYEQMNQPRVDQLSNELKKYKSNRLASCSCNL